MKYVLRVWPLRIGANTIKSIYPEGKQKQWMDRPEEKTSNPINVGIISRNFEGYLAVVRGAKKGRRMA